MEILGLEKVSFVDYEGFVCATIFTGGCNFNCPFCHNSSIVKKQENIIEEKQVLEYLKARTKLLDAVTISGGEPTLQPDLESFIGKIKALGYKVKLDTNGTRPDVLEKLFNKKLVDYVAMDIKNNFNDYSNITGVKFNWSEKVKESLSILKQHKIAYELRTTLVKNFHKKENIIEMANDLEHENILYLQKFVDSGSCIEKGLEPVELNDVRDYQKILNKKIKSIILRGYS